MSNNTDVASYGVDFQVAKNEELGEYYVIYHAAINDSGHQFVVFKIEWRDEYGVPYFQEEGEVCNMPGTSDPTKAEEFLQGSVKWDGCSDWRFRDGDCMLHFCGQPMATSIGSLMERMYDIAAAEMKGRFDRNLAGMPPLIEGTTQRSTKETIPCTYSS